MVAVAVVMALLHLLVVREVQYMVLAVVVMVEITAQRHQSQQV
jgi:hypothetical protein